MSSKKVEIRSSLVLERCIWKRSQASGVVNAFYTDESSILCRRYMVATQLESIFARQMFPCFDEPDLKSTFSIVVVRKPSVISLSNMNRLRTEPRYVLYMYTIEWNLAISGEWLYNGGVKPYSWNGNRVFKCIAYRVSCVEVVIIWHTSKYFQHIASVFTVCIPALKDLLCDAK